MKSIYAGGAIVLLALLATAAKPAWAQDDKDDPKLGWSSTAELSYVLTAGNSESTTLGLNGTADRRWSNALLQIKMGALRVETTTIVGFAVGTGQADFTVPEITALTAENYVLAGKYDRDVTEKLFWFVAAGWMRNEFAGIENRYLASGGIGNIWHDRERFSFRTNYGVSYTSQKDIVESPFVETDFAGLLFLSNLKVKFGKNDTEYGNDFLFNYSLADSDNWRWTMDQWITMSLTDLMAFKISLISLYNNVPAVQELDLIDPSGTPTGTTVLNQLDELDTIFGISLVLNF